MKILAIHLIGFGKFANRKIEFNNNFNLLLGNNEAGKTTVINAILGVLFGFKGRRDDIRNLKSKYRPWDNSLPYQAAITFTDNENQKYYINRNFETDKAEVLLWSNDSYIPAGKTPEQILDESLGLRNLRIFESTLLIRQEEIANLENSQLNEAITQKITDGGDEINIKNVFKLLDDKQKELSKGLDRITANPGLIKNIKDEIEEIEKEITALEKHEIEYAVTSKNLKTAKIHYEEIIASLDKIQPQLKNYREKSELVKKRDAILSNQFELQNTMTKIDEKAHLLNNCQNSLSEFNTTLPYFNQTTLQQLDQLSAKLLAIEDSITNCLNKIKKSQHQIEQSQIEKENVNSNMTQYYKVKYSQSNLFEAQRFNDMLIEYRETLMAKENELARHSQEKESNKTNFLFVLGCLLMLSSLFGLYFKNLYLLSAFGFLFLVGIYIVFFSRKTNKSILSNQLKSHLLNEIEGLNQSIINNERILKGLIGDEDINAFKAKVLEIANHEKDIDFLNNKIISMDTSYLEEENKKLIQEKEKIIFEIENILLKAQVIDIDNYKIKYHQLTGLNKDLQIYSEALKMLSANDSIEDLKSKLNNLSVELLNINHQIESYQSNLTSNEYESIKSELETLIVEKDHIAKEIIKLDTHLNHYKELLFIDKDIWFLRDQLAQKQGTLKEYILQIKSLELAQAVMRDAVEAAQSQLAPQVQEQVTKIFSSITSNKYSQLQIGLNSGNTYFNILAPEKGDFVDTKYLSTGTRDQFYLALRIALGYYLTNNDTFPIFLDDPFINFDQERLKNTLDVLLSISERQQIIWLSKDISITDFLPNNNLSYL